MRIIYAILAGSLYIAGRITGRRELFLLFFIMLFTALYALLLNLWTILSYSYVQELTEKTSVKGSTPYMKIGVYNDKPFPFTMMRINVERPGEDAVLSFDLSPRSHIYFDVPLYCAYRGIYHAGMTKLEVNDIFGLFRIRFDMRRLSYYRQKILTVYPKLIALPFLPARLNYSKAGGGRRGLSGEGGDYSELRAYRPGDPARRIHWKASISKRALLVKNFDVPAENAVLIAIDNSEKAYEYKAGAMDAGEYRLAWADIACECAAALARYCLSSGYTVAMAESDSRIRAIESHTQADFSRIYDRLAVMPFGGGGDIAQCISPGGIPRFIGFKSVYVISCREDSAFIAAIESLIKSGAGVKCIMPGITGNTGRLTAAIPGVSCVSVELGGDVSSILEDRPIPFGA